MSTDRGMDKDMAYVMEYYSAIKKEIMPFAATWTDTEIIILSEVRQRKTNIIYHLCLVAQSCLTLYDPMDCRPPGFSVHGISQGRILQWGAIPSSRESSQPRNQTPT